MYSESGRSLIPQPAIREPATRHPQHGDAEVVEEHGEILLLLLPCGGHHEDQDDADRSPAQDAETHESR